MRNTQTHLIKFQFSRRHKIIDFTWSTRHYINLKRKTIAQIVLILSQAKVNFRF